jgi:hypothetical protein
VSPQALRCLAPLFDVLSPVQQALMISHVPFGHLGAEGRHSMIIRITKAVHEPQSQYRMVLDASQRRSSSHVHSLLGRPRRLSSTGPSAGPFPSADEAIQTCHGNKAGLWKVNKELREVVGWVLWRGAPKVFGSSRSTR